MQINLKQAEIVEALKEYVGGQGINLKNKTFTVTFTAGRKEAGLLADISIETAAQVDSVDSAEKKTLDAAPPGNAPVVGANPFAGEGANAPDDSEDEGSSDASVVSVAAREGANAPAVKVGSLFGN